jgi:hypothetical protein
MRSINVIPVASAQGPTPPWKILVLIYEHTDFSFSDGALSRRVVADLTVEETAFAASEAVAFVERDIPALDSHQMRPSLEVRYPARSRILIPSAAGGRRRRESPRSSIQRSTRSS